jgi:hypothetical protein
VILDIIVAGKGEKEGVTGEREREDFVRARQFHTVNIITSLRGLMRGLMQSLGRVITSPNWMDWIIAPLFYLPIHATSTHPQA